MVKSITLNQKILRKCELQYPSGHFQTPMALLLINLILVHLVSFVLHLSFHFIFCCNMDNFYLFVFQIVYERNTVSVVFCIFWHWGKYGQKLMSNIKFVQLQIYVLMCLARLLIDLCLQHLMLLDILTGIVPPFALEVDIKWREKRNELSKWVRNLAIISLHWCI